jgi:hypothetical protein
MATSYQADARGEATILQLVERAATLVEGHLKEAYPLLRNAVAMALIVN